jgi:hypothetical protein
MTVQQVLANTSAYELTEWEAYERAFGPLGRSYEADVLATLVDAWLTSEDHQHHHPRPHEIFPLAEKHREDEEKKAAIPLVDQMSAFDQAAGLA